MSVCVTICKSQQENHKFRLVNNEKSITLPSLYLLLYIAVLYCFCLYPHLPAQSITQDNSFDPGR